MKTKYPLFYLPLILFLLIKGLTGDQVFAQNFSIQGHITDQVTHEPVPFVNVFFNNTTIGTTTDVKGNYYLGHLDSGLYNLVVSMVGYETISRDIRLLERKNLSLNFELKESVITLSEVQFVGKEDKQWNRNFRKFKREFLGVKSGYNNYEFINPYVLEFYQDKNSKVFRATADAPLEIINGDLGYKLHFFMQDFEQKSGSLIFFGQTRFEELDTHDPESIKQWVKNRLDTYKGSLHHFFRALIENNLTEEGFLAYRVSSFIHSQDVNTFYGKVGKEFREINLDEILFDSRFPDEKILRFNDQIIIAYRFKDWDESPFPDLPFQVSWIRLTGSSLRIHKSGFVYNPVGYEVFGYRSKDRVLQMLPFEYQPEVIQLGGH